MNGKQAKALRKSMRGKFGKEYDPKAGSYRQIYQNAKKNFKNLSRLDKEHMLRGGI
jgi:hypothetical protein